MTLETCKKRFEIAKKKNDKKQMDYWKSRAERKIKRNEEYKNTNVDNFLGLKKSDVKVNGKESKR